MTTVPYKSVWPTEWTAQRRSGMLLFGIIFLGLLSGGGAAGAIGEIARENLAGAVIFTAFAVYLGLLTALAVHSYRGGRHRADSTGVRHGPEGLAFRYSLVLTVLLAAFLVMTVFALIGMAVLAAAQSDVDGYIIAAILIILALLVVAFAAVFLKLAPGQVVVGPDGIHHRGLTFTHFVPWEAVVDVAALWSHSPVVVIRTIGSTATVTRNYLGRSTPGPKTLSPFDTISGRWLASDPAMLLQTVAYYIVHPADRTELSSDAALHRIQTLNT